jgi:hypothetical protein
MGPTDMIPTAQPTVNLTELMRQYLIDQAISKEEDLDNVGSPQNKALKWLAEEDSYRQPFPEGDISTPRGYSFLTRYALATLFYATNGESWAFSVNFLGPFDCCFWYSAFQDPELSQVVIRGVVCDADTRTINGLLVGESIVLVRIIAVASYLFPNFVSRGSICLTISWQ